MTTKSTTDTQNRSLILGDKRLDLIKNETLIDLFLQTVADYPSKTALVFHHQQLTYAQLNSWSNAIAAELVKLGISNGKYVGVWLPRGLELHATIIGILKAGATYVPLDIEMPDERVETVLKKVQAVACFTNNNLATDAAILSVTPIPKVEWDNINNALPDNDAYVLYTSGSTGKPKGIPITHRNICHLVRSEQTILSINAADKVYQGFSVSFDMWCEETWISYFAGATLWVADNATAKAIDELSIVLNKEQITVLHAVPSLLAVMEDDVPSIRLINAGGEACTEIVVKKWAKPGRRLYNSYGPTETTVTATITELKPGDIITIGHPLPNYSIAIIDEQKNIVPIGERGELVVAGPGLSNGYILLPDLTASKFIYKPESLNDLPGDKIYLTGDAAVINKDGTIDFQGRLDDQIKLRGYRIELGEIEVKLQQLAGVSAAAVAVKKDTAGEGHLIGYIIADRTVAEFEWRNELAKVLPPYMVPEAIVELKEFPRMPSGKLNRKELPMPSFLLELEGENEAAKIDLNAALEVRMLVALQKSFPGKSITLNDDFFTDLGGHSLLAAGFVSRLRKEGGVTYASLKDIYLHRPLKELAKEWGKGSQTKTAIKNAFNPIPSSRYFWCFIAQSISLLFIFGLLAVELFGPYVSYYYFHEEYDSYLWGILAAVGFYCCILPVFIPLIAAIKWLVIGKMKEGDYPLWGTYYFRWWIVKTLQRLLPEQFINGTPIYPFYLRLFGVKVASDAQLGNITIGAEDLVTIGSDVSLSSQVVLNNAVVEDGLLKLRSISIGDHAYIGSSAVISGDCIIEEGGELQDLSHLNAGGKINKGEVWYGSPAQLKETKRMEDILMPEKVSEAKRVQYKLIFSVMLFVFPVFILIPLLPVIVVINIMDNAAADYNFNYVVTVPLLATLYMLLFALETIVFTRLLNINIKPGTYSVFSIRYVRKWLSDQFMTLSLIVMHPIYASVYVARYFRLLGAKVGKNTEISTASSVTHPLLEIGNDAFVADAVTLGEADIRAQRLILNKTVIQHNSFVGNSALIPQGYNLPPNMLIGVLSTPPTVYQINNAYVADWFGSPAIALPRRQESNPFPKELTTTPGKRRILARATVEFIRIILPESVIICCSIFLIAYGHDLIVDYEAWITIPLIPIFYLGFVGIPAFLVTVMLKWIFIGKFKEEQRPMWTNKVWRSEAITCIYEALSIPFLLELLQGTAWLPMAMGLLGTKVGKRVWMNTTDITEYDMVSIGDDTALNEDSGPQTHLFEDRVMKVGKVEIGERCSIGARSIILYDTVIGNDVKIDSLSLIMKGELLMHDTSWSGSPVRPA